MKQQAFLILCICIHAISLAQPPRRDTTGGRTRDPWRDRILVAHVLEGRSNFTHIVPRERICFDKIIKIKQVTSRGISEACLFVNTTTGLVGHSPAKPGSAGTCEIKPETSDFSLFVMGLGGNTYHYFNQKKKEVIEHHVVTMNSQQYNYQFTSGANAVLKRKTESRTYCNDKARAMAYRVDGRSETWYLYGKHFPDEVLMTPKKFLGNYGVGYVFSDKGLFIIMQLESGPINSKIEEIRDEHTCFDPSGFKVFEEEFVTKATSSIQRKREKINRELASVNGACAELKRESLQFEREMIDRQEANVHASQQGHIAQQARTQQALGDAVANYDDQIQLMINETKYKICRAEDQMARRRSPQTPNANQREQEKLNCLRQALAKQINTQGQFQAMNREATTQEARVRAQSKKPGMIIQAAGCN